MTAAEALELMWHLLKMAVIGGLALAALVITVPPLLLLVYIYAKLTPPRRAGKVGSNGNE